MNRIPAALLAALEALIAAAVGIGVALVPLTTMWAVHYDLAIDWTVFWRASADIWLLGNGVDLRMTLDASLAGGLGLPGAQLPFTLTIAPLGFALIAVLFGVRAGSRAAATPHRMLGTVVSVSTYLLIAILVTLSAPVPDVSPSIIQGFLLPAFVYAVGVVIGSEAGATQRDPEHRDVLARAVRRQWSRLPVEARCVARAGLAGGTAAAATILAVASVLVAALIFVNYATIIRLYEGIQAGILGGLTLTLGQLAFIPNLVIWAASWLVGSGFALGTGSSVTPLGTELGPIPALPVLGALPSAELAFGFVGLLVPVLAGFFAGIMLRPVIARGFSGIPSARWLVLAGAAIGVVAGVVLGLLAWWSSGAAGPGRLVDVGADPWLVCGAAALEVGVAAIIGMLVHCVVRERRDRVDGVTARAVADGTGRVPGARP